ncbi:hypothetical protein TWF694_010960 [Orbilia ellipsospora]|uniref:BTB domain-containing protein n=1 Tax=Orbilia ellipsospora TaxID=2528407 RepID=A0AAV9X7K9_9PEZI
MAGMAASYVNPEGIKIHTIDANFDCEVQVNELSPIHIFRVSAANLRLASPIFAKSIDPNSPWPKMYSASNVLQINLQDDDPQILEILFKLMHFQMESIPKRLGLKNIFHLALTCDKYSCIDIAKPLIQEFITDLREAESDRFWKRFFEYSTFFESQNQSQSPSIHENDSELHGNDKASIAKMLLYVSFVFNLEKIFPKAYQSYLMIWQPKQRDTDADDDVEGPICLPDGLYTHFMAEWEKKRNGIVEAVNNLLNKYTFGLVYRNTGRCSLYRDCTICDISLYGSFIRRLCYKGIFPIREKSDCLSLYELKSRIKDLQIGRYWDQHHRNRFPHNECEAAFMASLLQDVRNALKENKVKLADFKSNMGTKRKLQVLDKGSDVTTPRFPSKLKRSSRLGDSSSESDNTSSESDNLELDEPLSASGDSED